MSGDGRVKRRSAMDGSTRDGDDESDQESKNVSKKGTVADHVTKDTKRKKKCKKERREAGPCSFKKLKKERRARRGQDKERAVVEESEEKEVAGPDQVIMEQKGDGDQGVVEGSEVVFHDKITIAPHLQSRILSLIFKKLDFRSLKQVRLVSKSWLRVAGPELKTRGIVRIAQENNCSTRIRQFLTLKEEGTEVLPQPFKSIDVDLEQVQKIFLTQVELICKLSGVQHEVSCVPIAITRLSPGSCYWSLALRLISKCSGTLEYLKLKLFVGTNDRVCDLPENSLTNFPKLRHVAVDNSKTPCSPSNWTRFSTLVSWVVNRSPQLENYESLIVLDEYDTDNTEFESELLLQLNLKTVKSLKLSMHYFNEAALEHLESIPFSRLENLEMSVCRRYDPYSNFCQDTLVAVVTRASATLKTLKLSGISRHESIANYEFPVCPKLEELTLERFPTEEEQYLESVSFLSQRFPALQVLNVKNFMLCKDAWETLPPFLGLKTLRAQIIRPRNIVPKAIARELFFMAKLPDLERLYIEPAFLMHCCRMKASGDSQYSSLMEGLKHVELHKKDGNYGGYPMDQDFSFLAVLKGIETVTFMDFSRGVSSVPVSDLPNLKTIAFPWSPALGLQELLKLTRRVTRIILTNCCSILRAGDGQAEELKAFFDSAPNAECGCEKGKPCCVNETRWEFPGASCLD